MENATPWTPEGWKGDPPTTCPGYTTKLPEVREVEEARYYLEHGSLNLLLRGALADNLRDGIAILGGADGQVMKWAFDNPVKKSQ